MSFEEKPRKRIQKKLMKKKQKQLGFNRINTDINPSRVPGVEVSKEKKKKNMYIYNYI